MARTYLAMAWGLAESNQMVLRGAIGRATQGVARTVSDKGQVACTEAIVLARFATPPPTGSTLFEVHLATGRTHQIRVHLADAGHPLLGDDLYAPDRDHPLDRHALHASALRFRHPRDDRWLDLASPLPADFAALLAAMAP